MNVRLFTRNLYVGASLDPVTGARSLLELPARVDEVWGEVVESDPAARMEAVAGEIAAEAPDVVAVQEAARWSGPGASFDLLGLLGAALARRGEPYEVAAVVETFSGALPSTGGAPVTLDDRGALLVRRGVRVEETRAQRFSCCAALDVAGARVEVGRGLVSAVVRCDGLRLRVLGVHLELAHLPPLAEVQRAQAAELSDLVRAEPLPVALLGDLNARPGSGAHAALLAAGLVDAADAGGPTCCEARSLRNERSTLDHRIDHALVRGLAPRAARRTSSRTPAGLWASDHAGVVVDLELTGSRAAPRSLA